jgi:hypothetical protein
MFCKQITMICLHSLPNIGSGGDYAKATIQYSEWKFIVTRNYQNHNKAWHPYSVYMTHEHEHSHEDGTTHTHDHEKGEHHGREIEHEHEHSHEDGTTHTHDHEKGEHHGREIEGWDW